MIFSNIIKNAKQYKCELFFVLLLMIPPINYYINGIIQYHFGMQSISPVIYVLLAIVGLCSYSYLVKKSNKQVRIIVLLLLLMSFITCAFFNIGNIIIGNITNPLDSPLLMLILYCIPALVCGSSVTEWEMVSFYMTPFCILIVILLVPNYYAVMNVYGTIEYMTISYNALLASCFCFGFGLRDNKIWQTAIGVIGFLVIITIGARGAAICSIVFVVFYLLKFILTRKSGKKRSIVYIILILGIVTIYIIPKISSLISSGDINSRVFSKMATGEFFVSPDREKIRDLIIEGIYKNPFGYGMWGDKVILQNSAYLGGYSHNIVLDFLAYFGIVAGPILLLLIVIRIYKSIIPFRASVMYDMVLVLLPCGFIMLFFSGTISDHIFFYGFIGTLMNKNSSEMGYYSHNL